MFRGVHWSVDKSVRVRHIKGLEWGLHPLSVTGSGPDPTWGLVATIRAATWDIARFAAWHLHLGADRVTIYLDAPQPGQKSDLAHPRVSIIEAGENQWNNRGKRPEAHQLRQAANATRAWQQSDLDWLVHIDVDEFLLPPAPMSAIFAALPADCALAHFPPVELLSPLKSGSNSFKKTARAAGQRSSVLAEVYPTFGPYLRGGFLSHLEGKYALRVPKVKPLDKVRFGIHGAFLKGQDITNRVHLPDVPIGHAHAPDWESFRHHLDFRRVRGSYRNRDGEGFRFAELLDMLIETEGEDGLRALYQEVGVASPDLLARLSTYGMLHQADLDLDGAVAQTFPHLVKGAGT